MFCHKKYMAMLEKINDRIEKQNIFLRIKKFEMNLCVDKSI